MTKIVTDQIQRYGSNTAVFTLPSTDGNSGDSLTTDGKGNLSFGGGASSSTTPYGQAFYGFGDGTYYWTCPPGVTSVCVVCIGGGASNQGTTWSSYAGGGGGLGWKNNIKVTPGTVYTVVVGKGGDLYASTAAGGDSYFIDPSIVKGGGCPTGNSQYGTYVGDGGGNGGQGAQYGGGGAGGYTGAGGNQSTNGSGGGGAGGGSYSSTYGGASGGGTGPFGQGPSGIYQSYAGGTGGSGGQDGIMGENPWYSYGAIMREGGLYGGGGGGTGSNTNFGYGMNRGGRGCVRIIWGAGRSFPSTGTGDW
ncbi:hypothetical protein UFOVP218_10 [uncultured Caudovirales phage]|uniref:Glycine-rich domain-containing protein n=1 Tax=uncultured Caudovirales phage TaxID=2100421 RepID=A0A6J7WK45_9CAUD|nr:hypothetical protein UFOVP218_10 [uncultured Caudovirales phage]